MTKGYNRYNLLLKIKDVNEIYLARIAAGDKVTVIYREYIYPKWFISRATFYNYLATPYNRDLAEFEETKQVEDKRQLRLFDDEVMR